MGGGHLFRASGQIPISWPPLAITFEQSLTYISMWGVGNNNDVPVPILWSPYYCTLFCKLHYENMNVHDFFHLNYPGTAAFSRQLRWTGIPLIYMATISVPHSAINAERARVLTFVISAGLQIVYNSISHAVC